MWQGQMQVASDFVLMQGSVGETSLHAHFAHQFLLSPGAPLRVQLDDVLLQAESVFIPSLQEHAIPEASPQAFTVFVEPLAVDVALLQQQLALAQPSLQALAAAVRRARQPARLDARIVDALAALDFLLAEKVSAHDLAQRASLSLSQLERLFGDQVGLPVRRLVLWRRLRIAILLALAGHTLTDAAHEAGFADAAHFSRTMRSMFGVRADLSLRGFQLSLID